MLLDHHASRSIILLIMLLETSCFLMRETCAVVNFPGRLADASDASYRLKDSFKEFNSLKESLSASV